MAIATLVAVLVLVVAFGPWFCRESGLDTDTTPLPYTGGIRIRQGVWIVARSGDDVRSDNAISIYSR